MLLAHDFRQVGQVLRQPTLAVLWCRLILDGETVIDTSLGSASHWGQRVLLLLAPVTLRDGQPIIVQASHDAAITVELVRTR